MPRITGESGDGTVEPQAGNVSRCNDWKRKMNFSDMISKPTTTTTTADKKDDWNEIGSAVQAGSISLSIMVPNRKPNEPAPRPLLKIEKTGGKRRGQTLWVQLTASTYGTIGQFMIDNAGAVLKQCQLADEKPTVKASPGVIVQPPAGLVPLDALEGLAPVPLPTVQAPPHKTSSDDLRAELINATGRDAEIFAGLTRTQLVANVKKVRAYLAQ